jgi:hypothetical protein
MQEPACDRKSRASPAPEQGHAHWREAPLRPGHLHRSIPSCKSKVRDAILTLFKLAIDSKLRGCDVVAVRVNRGA